MSKLNMTTMRSPHVFNSPTSFVKICARSILYHLTTAYLYMATDFKTVIIPVNVFALALTPRPSFSALLNAQLWLWLHLLQTDVSNQTYSGAEDTANRPWRPLPSGRISVQRSREFRWFLLAACFAVSVAYGPYAVGASTALAWALFVHDDYDWSKHIVLKNLCNAVGYASFECGTALVMASRVVPDERIILAIACSTGVILSTVFAQDFSDVEGDKAYGRRTVPIIFPRASRYYILLGLPLWSIALLCIWNVFNTFIAGSYIILGAFVGLRYFLLRDVPSDALSYRIYNVWLVASHLLPLASQSYGSH